MCRGPGFSERYCLHLLGNRPQRLSAGLCPHRRGPVPLPVRGALPLQRVNTHPRSLCAVRRAWLSAQPPCCVCIIPRTRLSRTACSKSVRVDMCRRDIAHSVSVCRPAGGVHHSYSRIPPRMPCSGPASHAQRRSGLAGTEDTSPSPRSHSPTLAQWRHSGRSPWQHTRVPAGPALPAVGVAGSCTWAPPGL